MFLSRNPQSYTSILFQDKIIIFVNSCLYSKISRVWLNYSDLCRTWIHNNQTFNNLSYKGTFNIVKTMAFIGRCTLLRRALEMKTAQREGGISGKWWLWHTVSGWGEDQCDLFPMWHSWHSVFESHLQASPIRGSVDESRLLCFEGTSTRPSQDERREYAINCSEVKLWSNNTGRQNHAFAELFSLIIACILFQV